MARKKRKNTGARVISFADKLIRGETKSGFRFEIDPDIFLDMEFIELIGKVDSNPLVLAELIEKMLGQKQKASLYAFVRTAKGLVPSPRVMGIIKEIFEHEQVKNSLSLPKL